MVKKMYSLIIGVLAIVCIAVILFATGTLSTNEKVEFNAVSFELPPGFSAEKDESESNYMKIKSGSEKYFYLISSSDSQNIMNSNRTIDINGIEVNITETTEVSSSKTSSSLISFKTYSFLKDNKLFYVSYINNIDNFEEELLPYLLK